MKIIFSQHLADSLHAQGIAAAKEFGVTHTPAAIEGYERKYHSLKYLSDLSGEPFEWTFEISDEVILRYTHLYVRCARFVASIWPSLKILFKSTEQDITEIADMLDEK